VSQHLELVHRLHQVWNTGDLDTLDQIYHPDFEAYWPRSSETPQRQGIAGVVYGINRIRTAFPDWHERVDDIFQAGDRVTSRYVSTGTHKGRFWDIEPTGKPIEIDEISIYQIRDGLVYRQWCMCDELGRLLQLGHPNY
jgi:predicted ester cyclase